MSQEKFDFSDRNYDAARLREVSRSFCTGFRSLEGRTFRCEGAKCAALETLLLFLPGRAIKFRIKSRARVARKRINTLVRLRRAPGRALRRKPNKRLRSRQIYPRNRRFTTAPYIITPAGLSPPTTTAALAVAYLAGSAAAPLGASLLSSSSPFSVALRESSISRGIRGAPAAIPLEIPSGYRGAPFIVR